MQKVCAAESQGGLVGLAIASDVVLSATHFPIAQTAVMDKTQAMQIRKRFEHARMELLRDHEKLRSNIVLARRAARICSQVAVSVDYQ
mgnify:CR=1 FL=1